MKKTFPGLTERQSRVAEMIGAGIQRVIGAATLAMSPKTYDTHRLHILKRLELDNNVELCRHGLREGWWTL
jgi:DNA-binding NarL/FixJ family response regulator